MREPGLRIAHRPFQPAAGGSKAAGAERLDRGSDTVCQMGITVLFKQSGKKTVKAIGYCRQQHQDVRKINS
jgi:hypothetical protein